MNKNNPNQSLNQNRNQNPNVTQQQTARTQNAGQQQQSGKYNTGAASPQRQPEGRQDFTGGKQGASQSQKEKINKEEAASRESWEGGASRPQSNRGDREENMGRSDSDKSLGRERDEEAGFRGERGFRDRESLPPAGGKNEPGETEEDKESELNEDENREGGRI